MSTAAVEIAAIPVTQNGHQTAKSEDEVRSNDKVPPRSWPRRAWTALRYGEVKVIPMTHGEEKDNAQRWPAPAIAMAIIGTCGIVLSTLMGIAVITITLYANYNNKAYDKREADIREVAELKTEVIVTKRDLAEEQRNNVRQETNIAALNTDVKVLRLKLGLDVEDKR